MKSDLGDELMKSKVGSRIPEFLIVVGIGMIVLSACVYGPGSGVLPNAAATRQSDLSGLVVGVLTGVFILGIGIPYYLKYNGTKWRIHEFGVAWRRFGGERHVRFEHVTAVAYKHMRIYLNGFESAQNTSLWLRDSEGTQVELGLHATPPFPNVDVLVETFEECVSWVATELRDQIQRGTEVE